MAEKTLPVELTQDEVVERALSLARVVRERERVEEEHLLRGREARSELKRLAVEARDLARAVEEETARAVVFARHASSPKSALAGENSMPAACPSRP